MGEEAGKTLGDITPAQEDGLKVAFAEAFFCHE